MSNNATTIGDFVNSGGGLMAPARLHGWLGGVFCQALRGTDTTGNSGDLALTAEGQIVSPGPDQRQRERRTLARLLRGQHWRNLNVLVTSNAVLDAAGNPGRVIIGGAAVTLPGSIDLTPATATNPVGTSGTVTATVRNGDGSPASGVTVSFSVTAGPDSGASGTGITNSRRSDQLHLYQQRNGGHRHHPGVVHQQRNGVHGNGIQDVDGSAWDRAPSISSDPATVQYSDALAPTVLASATDADSDPLTMSSSALPAALAGTDTGSGGFSVSGTATAVPGAYP